MYSWGTACLQPPSLPQHTPASPRTLGVLPGFTTPLTPRTHKSVSLRGRRVAVQQDRHAPRPHQGGCVSTHPSTCGLNPFYLCTHPPSRAMSVPGVPCLLTPCLLPLLFEMHTVATIAPSVSHRGRRVLVQSIQDSVTSEQLSPPPLQFTATPLAFPLSFSYRVATTGPSASPRGRRAVVQSSQAPVTSGPLCALGGTGPTMSS